MDFETRVLVVGGGPVGLTLAMDLADRGVDVIVADPRHPGEAPPSVKCNHLSARSMETFRRLGVAASLRNTGLPSNYPNDVVFTTTATGFEIGRIPIPCRADRYTSKHGPDTWWPTPEPPHRINQIYMEPLLFEHARSRRRVKILNRVFIDQFKETGEGVVASARNIDTNDSFKVGCDFLVGCDGGRSTVRRLIDATFAGVDEIQRVQTTYIRAPDLLERLPKPPPWVVVSLNSRRTGSTFAIDGRQTWLVHNYLLEGEKEFDQVDRLDAIRKILGVEPEFPIEIISEQDYIGRRLVASKFRLGRAFLCGDAAHLWIPLGGYGLNAGIADAMDLSWLLAAHLNGWAPASILNAYEAERLPVTEQVSHFAMDQALKFIKQRTRIPPEIESTDAKGEALRREIGQAAYNLNVQNYCCAGLNFGYFYDKSPIISYDGVAQPAYTMGEYEVSTVPGCRTPHVWLEQGVSIFDRMGSGFNVIRTDPGLDVTDLVSAASRRNVPMEVIDIRPVAEFDYALVLSRPDGHVAWRGCEAPSSPDALMNLVTGVAVIDR